MLQSFFFFYVVTIIAICYVILHIYAGKYLHSLVAFNNVLIINIMIMYAISSNQIECSIMFRFKHNWINQYIFNQPDSSNP